MILKINDRIRVRKLEFFNSFKVKMKYDAIASDFSFSYYFDPNVLEHKEMSCIGHYHICTVEHNDEVLITGNILSQSFPDSSIRKLVSVTGYSLTGVLEDSDISVRKEDLKLAEVSPYQFNNLSLREIAEQVTKPFGLTVIIDKIVEEEMNLPFEETTARPGQTIKSYLSQLASQKNIVVSHNKFGHLVFTRLPAGQKPIFDFTEGMPSTSMILNFDGQGMHSHIKVISQSDIDENDATENEVRNPYVINTVYRPKVVVQSSRNTNIDAEKAAKNLLAKELKGLTLQIDTDRWSVNGKIWRPGQIVSVLNPKIYLYKKANFMIESVELNGTPQALTATLNCVLPEVYNGQTPDYLFKGINLH